MQRSWRLPVCAWAGMSRQWPPMSSVRSPTAPPRFCGWRYAAGAWLARSTSWRDVVRSCRPPRSQPACVSAPDRRISPPLFGPLDRLADVLVHSGDIRIPLGLPFAPDPQLAALAMDFLTGPWPFGFVPLVRLRGISLHADDICRVWRSGAEICGPVAALMMAVSGRTALLHLLDGPGLAPLRQRVCS